MRLRVHVFGFAVMALVASSVSVSAQGQAIDGIIEGLVRAQVDGAAVASTSSGPSMPVPATSARW